MLNINPIWTTPFGAYRGASASSGQLKQVNIMRHTRQEARAVRRQGNWDDYLLMPTALLWLESPPEVCVGDECVFTPTPIVELWP
jgi:hypothetical protein